jgi:uncharacterized damage-inducible protein DinB
VSTSAILTKVRSPLPEPSKDVVDTKELFLLYLDFYRSAIASKVDGLSDDELRRARLPTGWTPIQLVKHLVFMERRWFRWGFAGEQVRDPWGDASESGRWQVEPGESLEQLLKALDEGGRSTARIVRAASLETPSAVGGRFPSADEAPALAWVLFHVLQEYARHAGHLDIVRELVDGTVGE